MTSVPVLLHARWLFHRFPFIAHRLIAVRTSSTTNGSPNGPNQTLSIVKEVLSLQGSNVSSWIVENKVKDFCQSYKSMDLEKKQGTLQDLALNYALDHSKIVKVAEQIKECDGDEVAMVKKSGQLKAALRPQYNWLFLLIGRTENGVKFLIDLRTDVMDLLKDATSSSLQVALQQLNLTLKELLSLWFTVGFLHLERITWKSSCEMLEKISDYEAVHKIRNWPDLKRRVGAYRRCYVYTHTAMPREPLIVLHTALSDRILDSVKGLVGGVGPETQEDPDTVKAAVFYSISSTQRGLQGIELGNYLIRRVAREVQAEFPTISKFSTLSPIPTFKAWLLERIKVLEKNEAEPTKLWAAAYNVLGSWEELRKYIYRNDWLHDPEMEGLLKNPLMASCAYYLFREKRRGGALDSVANFHLKNGAVMWRLNWMADTSGRGMANSCGMMINYRYYLPETEANSRKYLESKEIKATEQIVELCGQGLLSSKL